MYNVYGCDCKYMWSLTLRRWENCDGNSFLSTFSLPQPLRKKKPWLLAYTNDSVLYVEWLDLESHSGMYIVSSVNPLKSFNVFMISPSCVVGRPDGITTISPTWTRFGFQISISSYGTCVCILHMVAEIRKYTRR